MNSLNIDFRGECLRVLSAKDGALKHLLISRNFSLADTKAAKEQITKMISEVGGKKGKVNIVLPNNIVKYSISQIPAMDFADAEKVVRREISKELGTQDFVIGIRRIVRNLPGRQDILAEYALKSETQAYLGILKECGVRPSVMATSLEGIIRAFQKIRPETEGNEAVLEIGRHYIEIIVFNNGKLVNYKKVQMPAVDETKLSSKEMDPAQSFKMKMYSIVDALYKFILEMGGGSAQEKISRLWISGLGSIEEGTAEVLTESLGINSTVIHPFDTDVEHAGMYTAIAGLSMLTSADQTVNLLSSDSKDKGKKIIGKTALIAALSFYVILIAGGYAVLSRTENDLKRIKEKTDAEIKASQKTGIQNKGQQDSLMKIMSSNRSLYPIFRDIANLTPPGISLTSLDLEKTAEATFIRLGADLQSGDEVLRKSAISQFLNTLEATGRFALAAPPEIVTAAAAQNTKKLVFSVRAKFEVLK